MPSVCFYFEVHQPCRLRPYTFFDIGASDRYNDAELDELVMRKVADKCYLPMNALLLELIREHQGRFRCTFSLTGTYHRPGAGLRARSDHQLPGTRFHGMRRVPG